MIRNFYGLLVEKAFSEEFPGSTIAFQLDESMHKYHSMNSRVT